VEGEKEGKGKIYSLLHPCTRVPKWNSLWWLVEHEREEEEMREVALSERENGELLRSTKHPSCTY
jgi:hypothetical protein